jgi:hypothetical protein
MLDPYSFLVWSQGLDQSKHIGQAVNIKYTNMKIQIRFPQPSVEVASGVFQNIPTQPMNYELVWGWIPAPLQLTGSTTQPANTVDLNHIRNHINHRVADYFNDRKDKLRFILREMPPFESLVARRFVLTFPPPLHTKCSVPKQIRL